MSNNTVTLLISFLFQIATRTLIMYSNFTLLAVCNNDTDTNSNQLGLLHMGMNFQFPNFTHCCLKPENPEATHKQFWQLYVISGFRVKQKTRRYF